MHIGNIHTLNEGDIYFNYKHRLVLRGRHPVLPQIDYFDALSQVLESPGGAAL